MHAAISQSTASQPTASQSTAPQPTAPLPATRTWNVTTLCLILCGIASAVICGAASRSALAAEPATETERAAESVARPPADDNDLRRWLENMVWHHRFNVEEITAATGLATAEITAAEARFEIRPDNRPA